MIRRKKGTRVIALVSVKAGVVESFGAGEYVGDEIPPKEIGGFNMGAPNPKILLDSGETVWGCECWWGPEEQIRKRYPEKEYEWKDVSIVKARERAKR